jgi:isopenicillin-N N-acyltransferase-like protein
VVAQNWDAPVGSEAEQALFLHIFQGDFQFATVASFGGLGWVGCNRSGLAMVNNDLVLASHSDGVPSQIARRIFLNAKDIDTAVEAATSLPHMAGRAYIFGDAANGLATVEVSARNGVYVSRTGTFVAHTNHALGDEIRKDEDVALLARQYPSSEERLKVLVSRAPLCTSTEDVMEVLRNRQGTPDAVCKTSSPREPTQTAFSIAMQCWNRTLFIARGMPSMADYARITF